jgi:thiol-disulfide isomerase/thioredoxin
MQPQPSIPSPSSTRKWLAAGLALTIAWAVFAFSARSMLGVDEIGPPILQMSDLPRPAEFRWTLEDLDGKPVEFAQFKGRTILLNIWATFCPPCIEELPSIARLAASPELKGRDIAFVCVSTDENPETLRRFMKNKDWDVTVLRATSIPPNFLTDGIPATFLITPSGRVAAAELGPAKWDDVSVVAFLQRLSSK